MMRKMGLGLSSGMDLSVAWVRVGPSRSVDLPVT